MFIAKNEDLIILANADKEELEKQLQFMVYTEIVETEENYVLINGTYMLEDEAVSIVKEEKYKENDVKAEEARTSKTFTLTLQEKECEFDTKAQTQADLLTAFAVCSQGTTYDDWVCNNGVVIDLTLEDVTLISATFKELSNVYPHWNYYKNLIDEAETLEEVEAIEIIYDIQLSA